MSLRQRLFKKKKQHSDSDCSELLKAASDDLSREGVDDSDEWQHLEEEPDTLSLEDGTGKTSSSASASAQDDDNVYELQLTQLQEQLVSAMIDNENLKSELSMCRERTRLEQLLHDLECEREKVRILEERLEAQQAAENDNSSQPDSPDDGDEEEDEQEAQDSDTQSEPPTFSTNIQNWLTAKFYELLEDFTEEPDSEPHPHADEPLAIKRLKENISRFTRSAEPGVQCINDFWYIFTWDSPVLTAACFIVYMYAVWRGWLMSLCLALVILQLTVTYLQQIGWNINLRLLNKQTSGDQDSMGTKDLGVSDKFNVVLQVATKVQNTLGTLADHMEKLKNLLTWKRADLTIQLYVAILVGFLLSLFFSGPFYFRLFAFGVGIKLFIVNYMYDHFPRFKQKHDTTAILWKSLPTDTEWENQRRKTALDRYIERTNVKVTRRDDKVTVEVMSQANKAFCDAFSLPYTEVPLAGWEGGRRCTNIQKDKPLTAAFCHGRLYLTQSFLCFEGSKRNTDRNIIIPLVEIKHMNKSKPYGWMPGSGMAIEVAVMQQEKPYIFGALLNRDECYEDVRTQRMQRKLTMGQEQQ